MPEYLLLKWGTLKAWSFSPDNETVNAVIEKYKNLNWSLSAMMEVMTDEHKACVCELIDAVNGTIQNDWSGEMMTKEEAKKYIMEYGHGGR